MRKNIFQAACAQQGGRAAAALLAAAISMLGLAGCAQTSSGVPKHGGAPAVQVEEGVPLADLELSAAGLQKLEAGGYKASIMLASSSPFGRSIVLGATQEFERLGIETRSFGEIASADDMGQEMLNLLSVGPDVIVLPPNEGLLEVIKGSEGFFKNDYPQLVFLAEAPEGFRHVNDYAAVVSGGFYTKGRLASEALAAAIGGSGKVGRIDLSAVARDDLRQIVAGFTETIAASYPDIEIVTEKVVDPQADVREFVDDMLRRHPDLAGVFVISAALGEIFIASLRDSQNESARIVAATYSPQLVQDMVAKGNVAAIVELDFFAMGEALARVGAMAIAGEQTPPEVVTPARVFTSANDPVQILTGMFGGPDIIKSTLDK